MANELLTPNFWSINQLFKYRYCVPVYQRPYSWKISEVVSMLNDIWDSYQEYITLSDEEKQKASLYVGNIILHRKSFEVYDIIDGQQRITTFSIILLALYAKLFELNIDINNRILIKIQSALWKLDMEEKPIQDKRVIELGSIDKVILNSIFDEAYSQPIKLRKFVKSYIINSPFEDNVKANFDRVYEFANEKFNYSQSEKDDLLHFANYILSKVYLIAIINEDSEFKTFSIFESINSKGKKLEDIDLIKTRIFSTLDPSDYSTYLSKWGKLIIETQDNLYEYLKVYVKANIKYYNGNISFKNFESLDKELCTYFCKPTIEESYKALIEDMVDKLDYFNALFDLERALSIVRNNKFRFYYSIFTKVNYEHPRPLFFRCFCEFANNKLSKDDLIEIMIETIKFSITFLTVCAKDSKDAIIMFSSIFNDIYSSNIVTKSIVTYHINNKILSAGIRENDVISALESLDLYSKNKYLGVAVIATYESYDNDFGISWDEAYSKLVTYGTSYSLDHIMVQTPNMNDSNLKYYKLGNNLKLKDGHDFPQDIVHEGMEYENFKTLILHKAGNLRLKGSDGNSSKGNRSDESFNTYTKLEERNSVICNFFVNNVIKIFRDVSCKTITREKTKKSKLVGNYDFSMSDVDFTGSKPKSINICGVSYEVKTHKDMFIKIIEYLFNLDKEKLVYLAKEEWCPHKSIIFKQNKSGLRKPFELLKDEVYIEVNLNANMIFTLSCELLDIFSVNKSEVSVFIPE